MYYKDITLTGPQAVIGYEDENLPTRVIIDISDLTKYGTGTTVLEVKRPCDREAYIAEQTEVDGNNLYWYPTKGDLEVSGLLKCQVKAVIGDQIVKTRVYFVRVIGALNGDGTLSGVVPDALQTFVESVSGSEDAAKASAEEAKKAEEAAKASETAATKSASDADASASAAADSERGATQKAAEAAQSAQTVAETAEQLADSLEQISQNTADIAEHEQEYNALKEATLIHNTASGSIASFVDGAEMPVDGVTVQIEPVQDLHGYDSPWPAGGGKNLLKNEYASKVIDGVTFTVHDDGTVTANGTASADIDFIIKSGLSLEAGSYVLSGCPAGGSASTYRIFATNIGSDTGSSFAFTFNATKSTTVRINIKSGTTISNLLFKPMICLSSAQNPTTFAPYENICPITGWTGAKVTRTGKNLLDLSSLRGGNFETPVASFPIANICTEDYIPIIGGESYIWSQNLYSDGSPSGRYIRWYDSEKNMVGDESIYTVSPKAVQAPANACYARFMWYQASYFSYVEQIVAREPQLELGSTATTYEPYQGQTYDIAFPSEAGTVYGGTLDVTKGELVINSIKDTITVVDGAIRSSLFNEPAAGKADVLGDNVRISLNRISQSNNMNTASNTYALKLANLCKHNFAYASDTAHWYINNQLYLYLPKTEVGETVASYRTFLAEHPFEVVVELATPITYQLTPQEVHTLLGQNNIWADTGDMSVTYRADTKLYIDKKFTELQALILEN